MVRLSTPSEVLDLINAVKTNPQEYRVVVISSPFIDDPMQRKLVALGTVLRRASGVLRVITRREPADRLTTRFRAQGAGPMAQLFIVERLHAKVYLAIGRCIADSRAIVTSANLTVPGMTTFIEVGTFAVPTSDAGRRMVDAVRATCDQLTDSSPHGVSYRLC